MNQYQLKKLLRYYPTEGVFRHLSSSGGVRKGSVAGTLKSDGYIVIRLHGKRYYAHRLAWFYKTNTFPEVVDHINLDKADNRWVNLRACNQSQNQFNSLPRNALGVKGVGKRGNRYQAKITVYGKFYHLGCYDTLEEASMAYQRVAKQCHGEFFRC